jgi:very-short-patch-repair endonuclease
MPKRHTYTLADLTALGLIETSPGVFEKGKGPALVPVVKVRTEPEGLAAIKRVLAAAGIQYLTEHRFHSERRFRFDIAVPHLKLAVEYEGIFSKKSRHTSVSGYTTDADKYNLAQAEGWKVLRYTAKNYKKFIEDLKQHI